MEGHQIRFFRLLQLRGALKLELAGMRHSSGKSAYAQAKREFDLRGTRQRVLAQLETIIEAAKQDARERAS